MNANELRIGNYISEKGEIRAVNLYILDLIIKRSLDYEPIHITEEWLLKFGFEICTGHFYKHLKNAYKRDDFDFTVCFWHDGTIDLDSAFGDMFGIELKHIKYIHQLQNLYFALTEKELFIELNIDIPEDYIPFRIQKDTMKGE